MRPPALTTVRSPHLVVAHDYLTQRGGAERVVLCLARAFPDAPIVTSLYEPELTFPEFATAAVTTTPLQHLPGLPAHHRLGLPLYPLAFTTCVVDAPVTLCSTSGFAHGVRCTGSKVLYVYTPPRFLYEPEEYLGANAGVARLALKACGPALRRWDRRAAHSAQRVITISVAMRERIRRVWGLDAEVVYPPHSAVVDGPAQPPPGRRLQAGYFLTVARLLPYKGVDALLAAFAELPEHQLVVVGDGPDRARLAARRPPNVELLGRVEEEELRWLYRNCRAVVSAAREDFGLSVVEALAYGRPVAALRAGGFLETLEEGTTGRLFEDRSPASIAAAVRAVSSTEWDAETLRARARRFSTASFVSQIAEILAATR